MAKTIVGLFDTMNEAQSVVQELLDTGFNKSDISIVANRGGTTDTGTTTTDTGTDRGSRAGEGAATGAVGGTVVGGVIGLLVGVGALAIPGIGPVLAAGPIAAALGSTAVGAGIGAAAGGLIGALVGAGVPEEEAHYYAEGVRRGGTLVTVKADDNMAQNAYDIFQRRGAVDIKERGAQWQQSGWNQRFDPNAQPYTGSQSYATGTNTGYTNQTGTMRSTGGEQTFTSSEFRDSNNQQSNF